jgi:HEAT repeat protein
MRFGLSATLVIVLLVACAQPPRDVERELKLAMQTRCLRLDNAIEAQDEKRIQHVISDTSNLVERNFAVLVKFSESSDVDERRLSAFGFGFSTKQEAINLLFELLNDSSPLVQRYAATAIAFQYYFFDRTDIKPKAVSTLENILLNSKHEDARWGAAHALFWLLEEKDKQKHTDILVKALADSHLGVRTEIVRTLGKIKAKKAENAIIQKVFEDPAIKRSPLEIMSPIEPQLIALLKINAAVALSEIKSEQAIPYLIELLKDDEKKVVQAALFSLRRITGAGIELPNYADWKEWYRQYKQEKEKKRGKDAGRKG